MKQRTTTTTTSTFGFIGIAPHFERGEDDPIDLEDLLSGETFEPPVVTVATPTTTTTTTTTLRTFLMPFQSSGSIGESRSGGGGGRINTNFANKCTFCGLYN